MTDKVKMYLIAGVTVLILAVGSASLLGVDETLSLFKGLIGIAQEVK